MYNISGGGNLMSKHKLGIEITESAYKKYNSLPAGTSKGQFVSDAIEEKYDREKRIKCNNDIEKKLVELEQRINVLEERRINNANNNNTSRNTVNIPDNQKQV